MRFQKVPAEDLGQVHAVAISRPTRAKFITLYDLYLILVCGLIKIADQWPFLRLRGVFAHAAAFAAFQLARRRRRIREQRLSQTLQFTGRQIRNIVKQSFDDFWHDMFFSLSPSGNRRAGQVRGELQGLEHVQEALEKGRGVILWESSFFGRRVAAKRILDENGLSVSQIHNEYHIGGFRNSHSWISKHLIQPFFESCEKPFVREIIYLTRSDSLAFTRVLAERLKHNGIICVSADGRGGHKIIPIDFLGRTDSFSTGMVSLAKLSGATILSLFCIQQNGGQACVIIEPPIRVDTEGDRERCLEKAVVQYASLLESYIKKYPEQYRNWHQLGELEARPHSISA